MFTQARLKLTAWYLAVIMLVSMSFSAVIYRVLTAEVERFARMQRFRIERRFNTPAGVAPIPAFDPDLVAETSTRIRMVLLIINGCILVLSGGFGYMLAGRTLSPIQVMMDEQNRFVSDASHELKTPLTSLRSAFEVYLRGKSHTAAETKTLVTESLDEVNRLQTLVESLLTLARSEQTNDNSQTALLSLADVVSDAKKKCERLAAKKRVDIRVTGTDADVRGNDTALTELLVILLDNAVKYSPKGSVIDIVTSVEDKTARIAVTDHGIGIAKEDLPNIFDRFYRADNARTRAGTGGYGLGLSIAKKLVEAHHGSILVESEPETGSTFTVVLPLVHFS